MRAKALPRAEELKKKLIERYTKENEVFNPIRITLEIKCLFSLVENIT